MWSRRKTGKAVWETRRPFSSAPKRVALLCKEPFDQRLGANSSDRPPAFRIRRRSARQNRLQPIGQNLAALAGSAERAGTDAPDIFPRLAGSRAAPSRCL